MENGRLEDRSMRNGDAYVTTYGTSLWCVEHTFFIFHLECHNYSRTITTTRHRKEVSMESTQKQRVTLHAGRCHVEHGKSTGLVYSNKHNDRNFDTETTDNICTERIKQNLLYLVDEEGTITEKPEKTSFADWEFKMYQSYYAKWLEKQTERHKAAGHNSRVRTMEQIISSPRFAPREEILSIGNFTNQCQDEEAFIDAVDRYVQELQHRFPYIRILNYSVHRDEEVRSQSTDTNGNISEIQSEKSNVHAHIRSCFVYLNEDGDFEPNQNQALAAMKIEPPNPDGKIDRYNNRISTMTSQCRTLFHEIAMEHGFSIETEVESPGKKTLNKQEYLAHVLKKETAELSEQRATLQTLNDELTSKNATMAGDIAVKQDKTRQLDRERKRIEKRIDALQQEESRLKGVLRHLRASIKSVEALFTKLATYIVRPGRSVLDDVLLDARTAGSREALCEAERV